VNWLLVALLGYLAAQLAIGVWAAPRIHTEDDFLVAGRRLGYPLTVFTIFATWFGAETCIASAGRAYREGISLTTAEPFGYGLCLVLMGLVFAVPLWRRRLTTLADLFRTRYSVAVERVAALVLIPSSLLWAAAQLRGFAHVLATVTTIDLATGIAVAAAFCVLYTTFGGLLADAVTDLVQGILLVIGLAVLAAAVVLRQGGIGDAFAAIDPSRLGLVGTGTDASFLGVLEEWAIPYAARWSRPTGVAVTPPGRPSWRATPRSSPEGCTWRAGCSPYSSASPPGDWCRPSRTASSSCRRWRARSCRPPSTSCSRAGWSRPSSPPWTRRSSSRRGSRRTTWSPRYSASPTTPVECVWRGPPW
jgi:hypothetical protein